MKQSRPRDGAMLQRILHAPIPTSRPVKAADGSLIYVQRFLPSEQEAELCYAAARDMRLDVGATANFVGDQ